MFSKKIKIKIMGNHIYKKPTKLSLGSQPCLIK